MAFSGQRLAFSAQLSAISVALAFVFVSPVSAKGPTVRISVQGPALGAPIEITDQPILAKFNVWAGLGVTVNGERQLTGGFADWARGAITQRPQGLERYEAFFYVRDKRDLGYVITYEYDAVAKQGYIYLPGKKDEWYGLNVSSIFRGVEGNWLAASKAWDEAIAPLLPASSTPPAVATQTRNSPETRLSPE
jgi:hypothetical protein